MERIPADTTRIGMAAEYAHLIILEYQGREIDWPSLNNAIIERWSKSGLRFIKKEAWKLIEVRFPTGKV